MITNILVPTDFSPVAKNALKFALQLAEKANASVHLLHVKSIPVADSYFIAETYQLMLESIETEVKASFKKLEKTLYKDTKIHFRAESVLNITGKEITTYAEKNKTDLIVMGTTGASGLEELLIGSFTTAVISASRIPVLAVPPNARYHDLKKIVYATDYREPEFPAVARLLYFAGLYKAGVTVLHVQSEFDKLYDSRHNFFVKNKKHISYKKWKLVEIPTLNLMEGINQYIRKEKADLLVMAKHNRNFFDRLFHRSLSKRMACHSTVPLLVLDK